MTSGDDFATAWRTGHGLDPHGGGRVVTGWLRLVGTLARPLARTGVPPSAVTLAGLALAVLALVPALAGRASHSSWLLLVPVLVALSALADGLDGAVAIMTGTASRRGALLDAGCDRVAEAAFGAVLWALGAPVTLAVAAVGTSWLLEYLRERAHVIASAGSAGSADAPGVILTVAERPMRVAITAMFSLGVALWPTAAGAWAATGAASWAVLGAASLVQFLARSGRLPA
ncbi:MAG TPA: CDP-alcohol phosphatidyltransferase family protein [Actinomycetales bacterium]|nr:CDP-alcohol phosphatidyltransferase family protein [Actinomycetales bacterium]